MKDESYLLLSAAKKTSHVCCKQKILCSHNRQKYIPCLLCSATEVFFALLALVCLGFIASSKWSQRESERFEKYNWNPRSLSSTFISSSRPYAMRITNNNFEDNPRNLLKEKQSFFDLKSVPFDIIEWVGSVVTSGNCSTKGDKVLIAACCFTSCGGFGDRLRGIATLLRFAEATQRTICIPQSFISTASEPACSRSSKTSFSVITGDDIQFLRDVKEGNLNGGKTRVEMRFNHLTKEVRLIASLHPLPLPEFGLPTGYKFINTVKVGMVALALAGSVNDVMIASRNTILSALSLHAERRKYVALHIRCGGSPFTVLNGNSDLTLRRTTGTDNGFNYSYPDQILVAFKKVPNDIICRKALFISTDSAYYRSALENIVPDGITCISCCGRPYHIDKLTVRREHSSVQQHLVDVQAFGSSQRIFGSGGGFAIAGSASRSWNAVPIQMISRRSTQIDANRFVMDILDSLECFRASKKTISLAK